MNFDVTYCGAVMRGINVPVYTQRADGKFASAWINDTQTQVVLTGYTAVSPKGNKHYQTTSGGWIYLPDGWEQVGTRAISQYSQAQAQAQANRIIKNNQSILCNNLLCARYADRFSYEQQQTIRDLQHRLDARNEALQAGGLTSNIQTSYPAGFVEFEPYLTKLMAGGSIGLATWVVVVIACTVVAATATAAYFAYKAIADESEKDVKYSQELTRVLTSKLTEEEYQQLLNETKGIVTKARIKQAIGSYGNVIKIAAIAFAGYTLYKLIKSRM